MTQTTALYTVIVFIVLFVIYDKASSKWRAYRAKQDALSAARDKAREEERAALIKLAASVELANSHGVDATKLLAGTMKACESIAQATVDLRGEIAGFSKLVGGGGPDKNYPADNYLPPAEGLEAEKTANFVSALLRGMPADLAQQQADELEQKKTMLSAISMGPGEE